MTQQPDLSDDLDVSRDELSERLDSREADELRELLLEVTEHDDRARRMLHLRTLEGDEPDVDLEDFRERAESIFSLRRGAFGKPEARGDDAYERDVRMLVEEIRDYRESGFREVADDMARILLDVLDDQEGRVNPHRGWRREVERALRDMRLPV